MSDCACPSRLDPSPARRCTLASRSLAAALVVMAFVPGPALAAPPVPAPLAEAAPSVLHPEAPLPADALVPGTPAVRAILCTADTADAAAPAPEVRVDTPWAAQPVMTGAGDPVPVRFFKRGRTLIFDAGAEVIYIERDHRRFTYTASGPSGVVKWRGICRAEQS